MEILELEARKKGDPFFAFGRETHVLITTEIDINNPLVERFKDTRTVYEQYCAGEKYLKYNENTLWSKAAYEYMFDERRNRFF